MPELNCILLLLNIPFQNHLFLNVVKNSAQTRGTPVDFGDLQIFDSKPLHAPFRLFFSVSFSKAFIVYFTFQPRKNKRRNPPLQWLSQILWGVMRETSGGENGSQQTEA